MSAPVCDMVIPAFNEAVNVPGLLESLGPWGSRLRHIVVADNASTDGTAEAARAGGAVVVHEPQRGYGAACLRALRWIGEREAPPDVVVFLDADGADDPSYLPALLAPIERGAAELVIGSRPRRAEPGALNLPQRAGNRLACAMMAVLAGRRHSDLGPFRAITWNALQRLDMQDRTWGWTVEMQMKAALLGVPAVEIDVPYRPRRAGRSKISGTVSGVVRAGTRIIATILVLRLRRRSIRAGAAAMVGSLTPVVTAAAAGEAV